MQYQQYHGSVALYICTSSTNYYSSKFTLFLGKFTECDHETQVGTSFLIASTAFLLINSRMSDIFGRKTCLLMCLAFLAVGDLLCGFAQTSIQLFIFRALSGIGAGGINSLVMVIVSDITTLKERGKYQGYLETFIALGNGVGPLIGGAFSEGVSWRWTFFLPVILTAAATGVVVMMVPKSRVEGSWRVKVGHIDFWGIFLSLTAVLFILIPISGGGSTYNWDSPLVIALLVVGGVASILFVAVEWKVARVPVMPMRIFEIRAAKIIIMHFFLTGIVYWGNLYFLPLYYQNVRGYSPVMSGVMILPLVLAFSLGSSSSGVIISRVGKYNAVLRTGYILWTAGAGGRIALHRTSHVAVMVITQIIEGVGVGCCFQPGMIVLLANSRKEDRAAATGLRNFVRTVGGAVGLAAFSAILNNVLLSNIPSTVSPATALQFTTATGLTDAEQNDVVEAYMKGIHVIMCIGCPLIGFCVLTSFLIKDVELEGRKEPETVPETVFEDEERVRERADEKV